MVFDLLVNVQCIFKHFTRKESDSVVLKSRFLHRYRALFPLFSFVYFYIMVLYIVGINIRNKFLLN